MLFGRTEGPVMRGIWVARMGHREEGGGRFIREGGAIRVRGGREVGGGQFKPFKQSTPFKQFMPIAERWRRRGRAVGARARASACEPAGLRERASARACGRTLARGAPHR